MEYFWIIGLALFCVLKEPGGFREVCVIKMLVSTDASKSKHFGGGDFDSQVSKHDAQQVTHTADYSLE